MRTFQQRPAFAILATAMSLALAACAKSDQQKVAEYEEAWGKAHAKEIAQIKQKVDHDHSTPDKPQTRDELVYGRHIETFFAEEQRASIVHAEMLRLQMWEASEDAANLNKRNFRSQAENDALDEKNRLIDKAFRQAVDELKTNGVCRHADGYWMRCM
mgnify:CR=1 FL=1